MISILPGRQLRAGVLKRPSVVNRAALAKKRVRFACEGAVNDEPEALHGVGEAQDKPCQHVLWQPDVFEKPVQLLHLAALKSLPRQLGSEFGEPDVLALIGREDQRRKERQTGGTQAPGVFGEVGENGRMG